MRPYNDPGRIIERKKEVMIMNTKEQKEKLAQGNKKIIQ